MPNILFGNLCFSLTGQFLSCRCMQLILTVRWPRVQLTSPNNGWGFVFSFHYYRNAAVSILAQRLCTDAQERGSVWVGNRELEGRRAGKREMDLEGKALLADGNACRHPESEQPLTGLGNDWWLRVAEVSCAQEGTHDLAGPFRKPPWEEARSL